MFSFSEFSQSAPLSLSATAMAVLVDVVTVCPLFFVRTNKVSLPLSSLPSSLLLSLSISKIHARTCCFLLIMYEVWRGKGEGIQSAFLHFSPLTHKKENSLSKLKITFFFFSPSLSFTANFFHEGNFERHPLDFKPYASIYMKHECKYCIDVFSAPRLIVSGIRSFAKGRQPRISRFQHNA